MDKGKFEHEELTYEIIGLCYDTFNEFGYGYREKMYEDILFKKFTQNDYFIRRQQKVKIHFKMLPK